MSAPTSLSLVQSTITRLFPWLARFGVSEATKALEIRSASSRIEIEGGGPAVARVGDFVVRLAFFPGVPTVTPPSLWISTSPSAPYAWSQVAATIITGPLPADAGTVITVTTGSEKVTCG